MTDKNALRKQLKNRNIKADASCDKLIFDKFMSLFKNLNTQNVMIYMSNPQEVTTDNIVHQLLQEGKKVFVPVTLDIIKTVEINQNSTFRLAKYDIREPKNAVYTDCEFDVIVVPIVGFDRDNGNRLGHGKGYYDRFLQNRGGLKIGLAYEIQAIDGLICEKYDIPLDYIITEKNTYKYLGGNK